jgi:hypothetical protein
MARLFGKGKSRQESDVYECAQASEWLDAVMTSVGDFGLISRPVEGSLVPTEESSVQEHVVALPGASSESHPLAWAAFTDA